MSWWQQDTPSGDTANLDRFLSFLKKAEGGEPNIIVGGGRFSDFSQHPRIVGLRTKEGPSTAAGDYQITASTYDDVAPKIGVTGFTPADQRAIAVELIRRKGALEDINGGDFNSAINKLGSTWASLPSSPYSQPKKSWDETNKMLGTQVASAKASENWWSKDIPVTDAGAQSNWWAGDTPVDAPAAAVGLPQPTPSPTLQATPQATPQVVPAPAVNPAAAISTEQPLGERIKRSMGTVGRTADNVVRGLADTLTFGYADEFAAKMDSLTGGGQSGKRAYDEALVSQRKQDSEGGAGRVVGQIGGALIPSGLAIQLAAGATRLARAGAGALTGAVQGGLYGAGSAEGDLADRAKGAAVGAGTGAVLGGALSAVLPVTKNQTVNRFVKDSGGEDLAKADAEIIKRAQSVIQDPNRMTGRGAPVLSAKELNGKVTDSFLREGKEVLASLPKDFPKKAELQKALGAAGKLTPDEVGSLRTSGAGNAVADIILRVQRADKVTAALPARGGLLGTTARTGVDALPAVISATTGVPVVVGSAVTEGLKQKLGGRLARERVAEDLLKRTKGADLIAERLGPSQGAKSLATLSGLAKKAASTRAAQIEAGKQAATKKASANAATKLQVLKDTKRPLSGAFQELLPGGAANLNLSSKQAIDALRLTSRQFKDRPVGTAAQEILRSGNVPNKDAFYGLQNQLRKLQEEGVLAGQPGALSAVSSGVRNPASYEANVSNAMQALKVAKESAPNKQLEMFASQVAAIKSPTDKAAAIAERLAKTSNPAEAAFLTQFVEPLAKFGKKTKK